jgi:hypothetical protein
MIMTLIINGILYTDIIKTPNLWRLLKTLVPDGEKNPQLVLALTVVFKGHLNSQNLLATQLGMYLNSNGVKDAVITQMNRLGLSISIDSIQRRLQLLTIKQKQLIRKVSSQILTTPLIFVYDNIQLSRVAQARIDSHDQFLKGTSGFLAQAIVGEGRTLPTRDSFMAEAAANMKVEEILPISLEDEKFFVDVSNNILISRLFRLFPVRQSRDLLQSLLMNTF